MPLDRQSVVELAVSARNVQALFGPLVGPQVAAKIKAASDLKGYLEVSQQLRVASCTLDVLEASSYLTRAGMQIKAATVSCQAPVLMGWSSDYKQQACTADASGVFSSIAWVAAYLSMAASKCGRAANVPAVCAGTIEGIIAGLSAVAGQASFVAANCGAHVESKALENTETDSVWSIDGRRLDPSWGELKIPADRDTELGLCVLDYATMAINLAEMGTYIQSSVRGCAAFKAESKARVVGRATQAICSAHIGHVLFSVGQAATFIAAGTSHCFKGISAPSLCAAGIGGLLSTLAGVVYLGSAMDLTCTTLPKMGAMQGPFVKAIGQGIARRLRQNFTADALI